MGGGLGFFCCVSALEKTASYLYLPLKPRFLPMKKGSNCLEPETSIYKWLFQLDDSQSLHRKWLEITKYLFINGCCLGFQVVV